MIWFVSFICSASNNFSTYHFSAHPRMPSAAPFFWPLFAIGSLIPMIFIQALPPPMEECILLPCNPHFSRGNCLWHPFGRHHHSRIMLYGLGLDTPAQQNPACCKSRASSFLPLHSLTNDNKPSHGSLEKHIIWTTQSLKIAICL